MGWKKAREGVHSFAVLDWVAQCTAWLHLAVGLGLNFQENLDHLASFLTVLLRLCFLLSLTAWHPAGTLVKHGTWLHRAKAGATTTAALLLLLNGPGKS
jgi:hypothetical protein